MEFFFLQVYKMWDFYVGLLNTVARVSSVRKLSTDSQRFY